MFLHSRAPQLQPQDGFFYKAFLGFVNPVAKAMPAVYSIITFLLLFVQAISLNKIMNSQRMFKQVNNLTGMSFLLITSLFSEWFSLSAPLIVNSFLIWIFGRLCTLYNNANPKAGIFNIGLVAGLCSFFYFPSTAFILLIMVGITIARPFRLQEWIIGLVGIITPAYIFASWLFISGTWTSYRFPGFSVSYPHFLGSRTAYMALALLAIATGAGIYFVNKNFGRQVLQIRKSWQLLFLYIAVAALVPFLNASLNFSYWILLVVPVSTFAAAAFFYPQKKIFPLILHWAMVLVYIATGFFIR